MSVHITEVERINQRIDPIFPSQEDLLAISVALGGGKAHKGFFGYGTDRIKLAVEHYTRMYRGSFDFMVKMREVLRISGSLTHHQAAAVLNCMLADARKRSRRVGNG